VTRRKQVQGKVQEKKENRHRMPVAAGKCGEGRKAKEVKSRVTTGA